MITISLCMIVKNEQTMIGQCLASVKNVVDEINIVDTGSTDQTKEIVAAYTNRIENKPLKNYLLLLYQSIGSFFV